MHECFKNFRGVGGFQIGLPVYIAQTGSFYSPARGAARASTASSVLARRAYLQESEATCQNVCVMVDKVLMKLQNDKIYQDFAFDWRALTFAFEESRTS